MAKEKKIPRMRLFYAVSGAGVIAIDLICYVLAFRNLTPVENSIFIFSLVLVLGFSLLSTAGFYKVNTRLNDLEKKLDSLKSSTK